ncbi:MULTISPECIES: DUF2971 domain-containing protein [Pacificibacter]|uniref:DUF2971 domain-containing protein n=1 Tax=Pacificibacter TaxID=1042323 RepID=UPI001C094FE7|nr:MULTISPECIES: DUF2971 domain-containing protein [Pacificibacter]MBU2934498.1 DUF2971 domain-containing protein [Pacificibacter marinus]MDO6617118.1 DUF2971 domain-containing protein [Pacificibacter sp. 1_MG-2023]
MTDILYKYRADGKFTESIITTKKAYLATAHQLNDPFECTLQEVAPAWFEKNIQEGMSASILGFMMEAQRAASNGEDFFGYTSDKISFVTEKIASSENLDTKYNAWRAFMLDHTGHEPSDIRKTLYQMDTQLTETGILSLSINPVQDLMWAHYGDNHYGVCFGFKRAAGSKLADPNHCLPVRYSDKLPEMADDGLQTALTLAVDENGQPYTSSLKMAFTDKTFQRVISTKPTSWAYEEEVRYVEPYSGLCDLPGPLIEVIFGLRCSAERQEHYIELLRDHSDNEVRLFKIKKRDGGNTLERVELEPPILQPRARSLPDNKLEQPREMSEKELAAWMEQLIQKEMYGEVIFQTAENLSRSPDSPLLRHIKATAHGLAGEHDKALIEYKTLSNSFPEVAAGWYGMACAYEAMGQLEKVVALLRTAYNLNETDPSITLNLGVHLVSDKQTLEEGMTLLRKADELGHRRARQIINSYSQRKL